MNWNSLRVHVLLLVFGLLNKAKTMSTTAKTLSENLTSCFRNHLILFQALLVLKMCSHYQGIKKGMSRLKIGRQF